MPNTKKSYGATEAENQNNALRAGAYDINKDLSKETGYSTLRNSTFRKQSLKKLKMADKARSSFPHHGPPKINPRKAYEED